jgi:hypothetical protein
MRAASTTSTAEPPLLPWQPLASFEAFGPAAVQAPLGVMVLAPVYVGADWQVD